MTHPYDLPGATCVNADPELFHPFGTGELARRQTEGAKRVCGRCPNQQACLDWAIDNRQRSAIWGGRTPAERRLYGKGPLPEVAPAPVVEPKPARVAKVRAVVQVCAKPGHGPSDMRKRPGRANSYYCQACSADRVRASRARMAEAVPA